MALASEARGSSGPPPPLAAAPLATGALATPTFMPPSARASAAMADGMPASMARRSRRNLCAALMAAAARLPQFPQCRHYYRHCHFRHHHRRRQC